MNQRWLMRQLCSYVPIFLLITSFLAYITFFSLTEMAKQSARQVNELATDRLLRVVDDSLQDNDKLVMKELSYNSQFIRGTPYKFMDDSHSIIIISVSVGVLSIAIGTLWFIYAIRMNYKPIGTITKQLKAVSMLGNNSLYPASSNELQIIEAAIDHFIQTSIAYEKTQEEDLMLRRRVFFHDVLHGNRIVKAEEWGKELKLLHLPSETNFFRIALAEIDNYSQYCAEYHERDKSLLKFVMGNVAKEMAASMKLSIWLEWLEGNQMSMLFMGNHPIQTSVLIGMLERYREWIEQHLKYTVTIGAGDLVEDSANIWIACGQAHEALEKKVIVGANQVILYEKVIYDYMQSPMHEFLLVIREVSRMYRMGEPQWVDVFNDLFHTWRLGNLSKNDAVTIVNLLLHTFCREMMELPEEYLALWKQETMPAMHDAFAEFESLEQVRVSFIAALRSFEDKIRASREAKQYASIVEQIRGYIDQNYTNPDISLTHLGEVFDTNPKYISFIFKEQLGVKFVDYLTDVRVEQAKRLLLSTDDLIPDIAAQVGYMHAVSFNRVFKKVVGITPGGYRNRNSNE